MNKFVHRLKPTSATLAALLGLMWALTFGALRDFVWADLKAGLIDLRGLSRVTRGLIGLGFALMALTIGLLIFNDFWRASADLIALPNSLPGRGTLAPVPLLPATLFLLSMAWSFALVGALHSHWAIRWGVLALFVIVSATRIGSMTKLGSAGAGVLGVATVIALFVIRLRWKLPLGLDFLLVLTLVSFSFLTPQAQGISDWRVTGVPLVVSDLNGHLLTVSTLAFPMLMLVGLSMAQFTHLASKWTVEIVQHRLPVVVLYIALGVTLALRLRHTVSWAIETFQRAPAQEIGSFLGALGVPLCVGVAWWIARRNMSADARPTASELTESADTAAPALIVGYLAPQLYIFVLLSLLLAFVSFFPITEVSSVAQLAASGYADFLNNQYTPIWRVVFFGLVMLIGVAQAKRKQHALALYLMAFALIATWIELADIGRPLSALSWFGPAYTDFWWTVLFGVVALSWVARRTLTPARAAALLLVTLMSGLLQQTAFINNRFTPFLGFAGVGFVAFGLIWDALTAGSWANVDSPGLPRAGRIFLYLGYVLLTVTLVNWALTTHDLAKTAQLTGDAAAFGLDRFGKPMLYALYFATLWAGRDAKS
ncbi:MAG: hypothetical protein RMN25_00550 [Anaerolineae bacterium]|nr:hypothetical protein [Thermoflexales bacterium]MDW8406244.1 hypothetical protein [Anaerolineae bacterium]